MARLTEAERQTLDEQIPLIFSRGLAGLWFENMNFEGFDPSFVAHVREIMSKSKSEARRGE